MSESSAASVLMKALKPLDPQRIESPRTGLGIPDVNFIGGWFEVKNLKYWPKKCDTHPVKFQHELMQEQKVWLYRRQRAGGLAMVAAKVSTSWFFFDGTRIRDKWDNMTKPQMIEEAEIYMPRKMEADKLLKYIALNSRSPRDILFPDGGLV